MAEPGDMAWQTGWTFFLYGRIDFCHEANKKLNSREVTDRHATSLPYPTPGSAMLPKVLD
jgi:hypothetical protein